MYIDAHAHLDKYDAELPEVLQDVAENQVFTVSVSMDPTAFDRNKEIAQSSRLVVSTFGIHPWNAPKFHQNLPALDALIDQSPMVGEIGLDYHFVKEQENHALQRKVFEYFVKKGIQQDKILNIHSKGAEADVHAILSNLVAKRAILHWYSGPIQNLRNLTSLGYYITVGVELLFSDQIKQIAKEIPDHLLLTETDNPGGYRWLTGEKGRPSVIKKVVDGLSEVRGWSHEKTRQVIFENFLRLAEGDSWAQDLRSKQ